jgi:hypothetical protein
MSTRSKDHYRRWRLTKDADSLASSAVRKCGKMYSRLAE